jgi:hypothetical protein
MIVRPPPRPEQPWPAELVKEQVDNVPDEKLKARLSEILKFALENDIFAESVSKEPQFSLSVQSTGGKALSISLDGSIYAFFGLIEAKKYPTKEARKDFIDDLKRLNLLPQNINPDEVKSGRFLERRLTDLTDDEFNEFLKILERNLVSK